MTLLSGKIGSLEIFLIIRNVAPEFPQQIVVETAEDQRLGDPLVTGGLVKPGHAVYILGHDIRTVDT